MDEQVADFSGYATKAGLKCSDGRTIMAGAFKHQDSMKVPLVWQHGHTDPENVLGHAILHARDDGMWAEGFFNDSAKAKHSHGLLEHKDITAMSIWANDLIERGKQVLHGAIREVSLVLSGANPGAVIENVTLRHGDAGEETTLEDEAIIYTGLELEHHTAKKAAAKGATTTTSTATDAAEKTVKEIFDSMSEEQQGVLHYMVGAALGSSNTTVAQGAEGTTGTTGTTTTATGTKKGTPVVKHNVFEQGAPGATGTTGAPERIIISHSDMQGIMADATKNGSLKEAVQNYALAHGIENIDLMFPEVVATDPGGPQFLQRRNAWVVKVLGGARKSPFSRIKTLSADITVDDARAKGYVTGTLKFEEFFAVSKRVTTPTTVYKKQKLDRDDMVDITDFDVVAWLKAEMRLMLDEEVARAILLGDGRDISDQDKINEGNIRPIASDHSLYTTTLYVNLDDANSSIQEFVDVVVSNRRFYKGTGLPTMFTTEIMIAKFLLLKDTLGRRIYASLDDLATELRVTEIVPVEVMESDPEVIAVFVNMTDYIVGATAGGEVSLFDFFDIDYNQYKYLIETRMCGALTRLRSALVVRKVAGADVLVVPASPAFSKVTGVLTITDESGVVYKNGNTVVNAAGSPYAAIAAGASVTIDATPAAGFYFPDDTHDSWTFKRNA